MDRVENTNNCHYKFINCKTGKVVWEGDSPVLTQELAPYSTYGAVDKYDALIRRKYLEMHRKLWNWIADETEKTHKCIDKLEAFKHFGWSTDISSFCWACQYVDWKNRYCSERDEYKYEHCDSYCLLNWGKYEESDIRISCANIEPCKCSPYNNWSESCKTNDWENAAKYAREIANLPERG